MDSKADQSVVNLYNAGGELSLGSRRARSLVAFGLIRSGKTPDNLLLLTYLLPIGNARFIRRIEKRLKLFPFKVLHSPFPPAPVGCRTAAGSWRPCCFSIAQAAFSCKRSVFCFFLLIARSRRLFFSFRGML